jgi:DNA-binding Xre family transcriptional regulator
MPNNAYAGRPAMSWAIARPDDRVDDGGNHGIRRLWFDGSVLPRRAPYAWPRKPEVDDGLELLGEALRDARIRQRMTQAHLERMSGIDQTTISRLERGKLDGMRLRRLALLIASLDGIVVVDPRERPYPGRYS